MVERRLSSPEEIKERYQKVGVVVFIFNNEGKVLFVREEKENPVTGKKVGDYSVICETTKEGESWEETVMRGLEEELGISGDESFNTLRINPAHCLLGESLFVDGVLARIAVLYSRGEMPVGAVDGGEISVVGWEKPEVLLSYPLRRGVRNVLEKCLEEQLLQRPHQVPEDNFLPLSLSSLKEVTARFSS